MRANLRLLTHKIVVYDNNAGNVYGITWVPHRTNFRYEQIDIRDLWRELIDTDNDFHPR